VLVICAGLGVGLGADAGPEVAAKLGIWGIGGGCRRGGGFEGRGAARK